MRFVHTKLLAATLAGAITLTGFGGLLAQAETPPHPFADLGLPELTITATDAGWDIDRAEVPAGRYLINLENTSQKPFLATGFVRLEEGVTLEALSFADELAAGQTMPEEGPDPASLGFLYDTLIVPGASLQSPQVVVDLPAGEYGVWPEDPMSEWPALPLTVTGDPGADLSGPEPDAAVTIVQEGEGGVGYGFTVTGEFTAGPQVVKIVNASDQPHFTEAGQYAGGAVTPEQVLGTFMFDPSSGATPPADLLDMSQLAVSGWGSGQSIGTTQWVVMDLEPGQVILACWISDPVAEHAPHAMEGMMQVFDVK